MVHFTVWRADKDWMHARRLDRNIVWVLVGGFSLTILLLIGAGFMGMQARDDIERSHASLRERHRHITRVIDEIQNEEAGLNNLFYAIVAAPVSGRNDALLLSRLAGIEQNVRMTLAAARESTGPAPWAGVTAAAEGLHDRSAARPRRTGRAAATATRNGSITRTRRW